MLNQAGMPRKAGKRAAQEAALEEIGQVRSRLRCRSAELWSSSDCCRAWAATAGRMVPRGSLPRRIHLRGADRVRCIVCYLISLIAYLFPRREQ